MNSRRKIDIRDKYNSKSYTEIYDRRYRSLQYEKFDHYSRYLQPIKGFLLDYGGGTGLFWDFLNYRNNLEIKTDEIRFICIDISSGMLDIFKHKLSKSENSPLIRSEDVHLVCCDGEHIPIRSNRFDHIYAFTSLQNLTDLEIGLMEIKRMKKENALIAISYLRKSITKELLLKKIYTQLGNAQIIFPKNNSPEDWLLIVI